MNGRVGRSARPEGGGGAHRAARDVEARAESLLGVVDVDDKVRHSAAADGALAASGAWRDGGAEWLTRRAEHRAQLVLRGGEAERLCLRPLCEGRPRAISGAISGAFSGAFSGGQLGGESEGLGGNLTC